MTEIHLVFYMICCFLYLRTQLILSHVIQYKKNLNSTQPTEKSNSTNKEDEGASRLLSPYILNSKTQNSFKRAKIVNKKPRRMSYHYSPKYDKVHNMRNRSDLIHIPSSHHKRLSSKRQWHYSNAWHKRTTRDEVSAKGEKKNRTKLSIDLLLEIRDFLGSINDKFSELKETALLLKNAQRSETTEENSKSEKKISLSLLEALRELEYMGMIKFNDGFHNTDRFSPIAKKSIAIPSTASSNENDEQAKISENLMLFQQAMLSNLNKENSKDVTKLPNVSKDSKQVLQSAANALISTNVLVENFFELLKNMNLNENRLNSTVAPNEKTEVTSNNVSGTIISLITFLILMIVIGSIYLCLQLKNQNVSLVSQSDDEKAPQKGQTKGLHTSVSCDVKDLIETESRKDAHYIPTKEPFAKIQRLMGDQNVTSIDKFLAWNRMRPKTIQKSRETRTNLLELVDPSRASQFSETERSETSGSITNVGGNSSGKESLEDVIGDAINHAKRKLLSSRSKEPRRLMTNSSRLFK